MYQFDGTSHYAELYQFHRFRMIIRVNATLDKPISAKLDSPILAFQYADDTAIIAHADLLTMISLKLVLRLFSKVSGLQINFEKSSFYPINLNHTETLIVSAVMGCTQSDLPLSYLGMPLTTRKPSKHDFIPLLEKIDSRIEGWAAKILSKGGRLQLIKSVLCSVPIYIMTCFLLPKWIVRRIEALCRNFLWGKTQGQDRGLCLVSWESVSLPKHLGGFGLPNLEWRNKSLLLRWWWKATVQIDSLWYSVISRIYKHRPQHLYPKTWLVNGSFFWNQLIRLHSLFQWCTTWTVGNGERISYWYNVWNQVPLRHMKDGLPRPVSQHISLQDAFADDSPVATDITGTVPVFSDFDDTLLWRWTTTGVYSASSVYKIIIESGRIKWEFREVWQAPAPSKVQIFSQLLLMDRLLTRERLQRLGFSCEFHCVMCDSCSMESAFHLFFQCPNAKEVWSRFVTYLQEGETVCDTWEASSKHCGRGRG